MNNVSLGGDVTMTRKQVWQSMPDEPGVYLMKDEHGEIIYVGKATSLKNRVSSYFTGKKEGKTAELVTHIKDISFHTTESALEALFLEANLIKKYKPHFNIKGLDDKSFLHIIITNEDYPRVLLARPTDDEFDLAEHVFGPYLNARAARVAMEVVRRMFPFKHYAGTPNRPCLHCQMTAYPEVCTGELDLKEYKRILNHLRLFLCGKKGAVIRHLDRQMERLAREERYEEAAKVRDRIMAIRHIEDIALLSRKINFSGTLTDNEGIVPHRVEAYDISNISGQYAVGSMVVFTDGEVDKSQYRKFKIRQSEGPNDYEMMREVLQRRFRHHEWEFPNLILMDGGKGQVSIAMKVLEAYELNIPVVGFAKGPDRKGEKLIFSQPLKGYNLDMFRELRDEAHRFAQAYYRNLHGRQFKGK
jgi:excinuclease ABC subunit C